MAVMTIDAKILRDPRMLRLAKRLDWKPRETIGALIGVWSVCYDRGAAVIESHEDIDTAADHDGFAEAMIAVGLASPLPEGIMIRGATKRLRAMERAQETGRIGGLRASKRNIPSIPQRGAQQSLFTSDPHTTEHVGTVAAPTHQVGSRLPLDTDPKGDDLSGRGDRVPLPPDAERLSRSLVAAIIANHPTSRLARSPAKTQEHAIYRWGHVIRLMHSRDRLAWADIGVMIEWSARHSFWRGVILGGDSLRDNWDTMIAQRNTAAGSGNEGRRGPTAQGLSRVAELEAEEEREERARRGGGR